MIRTRLKKVLLVAPEVFPDQLLTDYSNVKHVSSTNSIFPAIYESNPDLIVFDYDFLGKDIENILRRINSNKFYSNIKLCCYKNTPNEKIDGLLKALGMDQLIYREDLIQSKKSRKVLNTVNSIIDTSILKWVANVAN